MILCIDFYLPYIFQPQLMGVKFVLMNRESFDIFELDWMKDPPLACLKNTLDYIRILALNDQIDTLIIRIIIFFFF